MIPQRCQLTRGDGYCVRTGEEGRGPLTPARRR